MEYWDPTVAVEHKRNGASVRQRKEKSYEPVGKDQRGD
jgi:hypothetical protein